MTAHRTTRPETASDGVPGTRQATTGQNALAGILGPAIHIHN